MRKIANVFSHYSTRMYAEFGLPLFPAFANFHHETFFFQANKNSPEFTTKYKSTEQLIEINFTILILRLHQEGLTEILQFANNFQQKMEGINVAAGRGKQGDRIANAGPPLTTIEEEDEDAEEAKAVRTSAVTKSMLTFISARAING